MYELLTTGPVEAVASMAGTAQLRRRGYHRGSYRKNVCFVTLNGSGNGWSFYSLLNGFGGF